MSASFDVLVAGEYYCDVIFSGLDGEPALGREVLASGLTIRPGGCYNMALGLARLGLRTLWACDFGTDIFSRLTLDAAASDGIDPTGFRRLDRSLRQVSAAFSGRGERGFITYREATLQPPDGDLVVRHKPRWLLQTFRLEPGWLAFMRTAKASGVSIFGDCNDEGADLTTPGAREFIQLCDVFAPNEAEAIRLTGARDADEALARLSGLAPTVIIKRGPQGASAIADDRRHEQPAPAMAVVDTVGAGDAFAAGFLSATLREARFTEKLRTAVACGALSTTGAGSSANPTAEQLQAFLAQWHQTPSRALA